MAKQGNSARLTLIQSRVNAQVGAMLEVDNSLKDVVLQGGGELVGAAAGLVFVFDPRTGNTVTVAEESISPQQVQEAIALWASITATTGLNVTLSEKWRALIASNGEQQLVQQLQEELQPERSPDPHRPDPPQAARVQAEEARATRAVGKLLQFPDPKAMPYPAAARVRQSRHRRS